MKQRACTKCGEMKVVNTQNYYKYVKRPDGFRPACKSCEEGEAKIYRSKPYVKRRVYSYLKVWQKENRELCRKYAHNYHRKLRIQTLMAYGFKCACCREKREEFLTVDHIKGDGAIHRKFVGPTSVSRHLRQLGFPKKIVRLLCWNCHLAITHRGYCPHERKV